MLLQYNTYSFYLDANINDSIDLIQDLISQKISDRNYLQYVVMNSLNMVVGGEFINFKDTFERQVTYINKTQEINRIKEKQSKILDKLL